MAPPDTGHLSTEHLKGRTGGPEVTTAWRPRGEPRGEGVFGEGEGPVGVVPPGNGEPEALGSGHLGIRSWGGWARWQGPCRHGAPGDHPGAAQQRHCHRTHAPLEGIDEFVLGEAVGDHGEATGAHEAAHGPRRHGRLGGSALGDKGPAHRRERAPGL